MKLKSLFIKTIAIGAVASLAVNCHAKKVDDNPLLFAALAQTVTGLGKGNCAISLNLGTLYSGAIMQASVGTSTIFTQAEFEQAAGKSVTDLNYANFAAVPYNVKYDAFINGGGTYTSASRTTDIESAKAIVDAASYLGNAAVTCQANGATPGTTIAALLDAYLATFSATEQTAINNVFVANGTATATIRGAYNGGNCGLIAGGLAALYTGFGGSAATATAYQARQAYSNGTAILACARIPKSSCSLGAITTASRDIAIANGIDTYNKIGNNPDCRKTTGNFMNTVRTGIFTGLPRGINILGNLSHPNDVYSPISEGTTAPNNKIFAEKAYPISTALSNISTNFNVAFPISSGSTAQDKSTIPYYGASNVNLANVASCEDIGFNGYGPINTDVTPGNLSAKKNLSDVKEILYAFSAENTAAATYAALRGASQVTASATPTAAENDAIACNSSFRSKVSIPLAAGGGKMPVINTAISGDGGLTATLSTCLYGGTSAGRTTSGALLATTSLAGINDCPALAASAAAKFGDAGLTKLATFPND